MQNPPRRNNRYEKAYPFEPSVKAEGEKNSYCGITLIEYRHLFIYYLFMFTLKSPSLILMSLIASCSLILSTTSSCAMSFSLSASPSLPDNFFKQGDFRIFKKHYIQHCFICRP
jgi:hypothetical protein